MKMWTKYSLNFPDDWLCHRAGALELLTLVHLLGQFLVLFQLHLLCTDIFVKVMPVKTHCILERHLLTFYKRTGIFPFQIMLQLKNNQHILPAFCFGLHYLSYTAISVGLRSQVILWNVFRYLNYDDDFVFVNMFIHVDINTSCYFY